MTTTTTAVSTTGGFTGADVDGLDTLAKHFTDGAHVCDEVKLACEVIVAVASFFGPFAASFIAYLKGTVIPWLQKVSEALKLMSQVLSMHSAAQKDASSSSTSLPSYTSPGHFPGTNAGDFPPTPAAGTPALPAGSAPGASTPGGADGSTPGGITSGSTTGSTVGTPPAIGGLQPGETIGSLTVPVRVGADGHINGIYVPGSLGATPGTDAGGTGIDPSGGTGGTGDHCGCPPQLGGTGIDSHTGDPISSGTTAPTTTPPIAPAAHALTGGGGLGSAGGGLGGGSGGGTGGGGAMPSLSHPLPDATLSSQSLPSHSTPTADHAAPAAPELRTVQVGSHDGLFGGIGQATGIGAGAAALARATLAEARQRGDGSVLGAAALPFDADADDAAQSRIFQGSLV